MNLKQYYKIFNSEIEKKILEALKEDKIYQDSTVTLLDKCISSSKYVTANLICKEDCILAGTEIFKKVFKLISNDVKFKNFYYDGNKLSKGTKVLSVTASNKVLLAGERTALNFLQSMSGIATLTNKFVKLLKYKNSKILHTRKTVPNYRVFSLAAVKIGGGDFHRFNLDSAIMIKDNHIAACGGIKNILNFIKVKKISPNLKQNFEIEVKSLKEVKQVISQAKGLVKIVMLDNFPQKQLIYAVKMLKKHNFKIEISGGINVHNFHSSQLKGVDFYSIGAITHSYKSIDFSLEF